MLFGHKTHPLNFDYGGEVSVSGDAIAIAGASFRAAISCQAITDFCARLRFDNANVTDKRNRSDGILEPYREGTPMPPEAGGRFVSDSCAIEVGPAQLRIRMPVGVSLRTTADGFGFNGERFILNFQVEDATGFYGFGERTKRLNKNGDGMDFWTVDVVHVFRHGWDRDDYDPAYVAIPFAIIKVEDDYCGLYFDNPGRALIDAGKIRRGQLMYQSLAGNTDVYIINGPDLRDVVRHFTALTGRLEVPPPWSLGYHQSRWGYRREADFVALKAAFEKYDIPVSALWFDIDYMEGYRLFTWHPERFPDPAALNQSLKAVGIRSVVIVDPGVKLEPGYPVYDSGRQRQVFCKTVSGKDYVGRVWPGDVVFPDFTLERARAWWAQWLAGFIRDSALDGVWLDMNDPATGYSAAEDMRFQEGGVPHDRYHNQYGHFMAKASQRACDDLDPNARPFLLTRSGCTGTQRHSAVWTGDNASNWKHLRMSIPCTLNLGLSGAPFNGPDVGGFMGHGDPELLVRWYQAGFLFPFFRNHAARNSKSQEPWAFGEDCLAYVRDAIKTRYRLLPYLYQCFFNHYLTGDPVLRPLMYHYDGEEFENLDDQFLVGEDLMAAPILTGKEEGREVVNGGVRCQLRYITFPPGWWFDLNQGLWLEGGNTIPYAAALDETPLFVRDGAVIFDIDERSLDLWRGEDASHFVRPKWGIYRSFLDRDNLRPDEEWVRFANFSVSEVMPAN